MTNSDDQETLIEEAEVVGSSQTPATTDAVTPLLSLESMIREALPQLENLKKETKTKKEMLDDALNNDETYKLHTEKVKEATKIKTATKQQLLKQPALKQLTEDLKDLREQTKELQASLSEYLSEYARLSGAREIEDANGEVLDIVYAAKLVKRSVFKKN